MTKHRFTALIEKDEDGVFIGSVPSLNGCYTYGKTLDELMANLKEAIEAHLEAFGAEDFLNLFTAEITKSVGMRYLKIQL
ncbi:MAG: type II toxin-antitoxin system HicB family antitoxin [Methanophagales archaeon]|jgi:predicted RNase H-like HicB family nuclease|nr:type II toxin-antitoxin system HicB family antitoxin [Methanophagales archaeon]